MGDMGDDFRAMDKAKKERHKNWFEKNIKIIQESGFFYKWAGEYCIIFRQGNLSVDFYPHTGRWKYEGKMYSGGAEHFLRWYKNRLPVNY